MVGGFLKVQILELPDFHIPRAPVENKVWMWWTTICPYLLQPRLLLQHHTPPRKVSLFLSMPPYFSFVLHPVGLRREWMMNEWDSCTERLDFLVSLDNFPGQDFSICDSTNLRANAQFCFWNMRFQWFCRRVYHNRSNMNCSAGSKGPPCTG
jgi:hypothetical protein